VHGKYAAHNELHLSRRYVPAEDVWNILLPANHVSAQLGFTRSMTYGSAWVKPMDIKRASIWEVLALAEVEAAKEPQQQ
jgi:hypothetical protein